MYANGISDEVATMVFFAMVSVWRMPTGIKAITPKIPIASIKIAISTSIKVNPCVFLLVCLYNINGVLYLFLNGL